MNEGETDVEVVTQWGCLLPEGYVRWNPGYISRLYNEADARGDARYSGGKVVKRTEVTVSVITDWEEA